jgi:hypothetical protein
MEKVTAEEIARALKEANPGMRFAHHNDNCVGVWTENAGRFIGIYAKAFTGQWVDYSEIGLPLVNDKPVVADEDWIEVIGELSRVSRRRASSLSFLDAEGDLLRRERHNAFGGTQPD